jgi:hypothetical protein
MTSRYVIVRAAALGDLVELVDRALPVLAETFANDELVRCLRGSLAEVRADAVLEPA